MAYTHGITSMCIYELIDHLIVQLDTIIALPIMIFEDETNSSELFSMNKQLCVQWFLVSKK